MIHGDGFTSLPREDPLRARVARRASPYRDLPGADLVNVAPQELERDRKWGQASTDLGREARRSAAAKSATNFYAEIFHARVP